MLKREIRTPFHLIQPGSQSTPKAEPKAGVRSFKEGDKVWSKNFGQGDKWVPGVVIGVRGNVNYSISLTGKKDQVHRHVDQLRDRVCKTSVEKFEESESYDVDC